MASRHQSRQIRIFPTFLGLQVRVTTIAATLVALSVVSTALLLLRVTDERLRQSLADQAVEMTELLENRLVPLISAGYPQAIDDVLQREFSQNPHIAFIEVRDVRGAVLGRLTPIPDCWSNYQQALSNDQAAGNAKPIARFGPTSLRDPEFPEGIIYEHGLSAAVLTESNAVNTPNRLLGTSAVIEVAGTNGAGGSVLLGLVDPGYRRALASLHGTAIIIVAIVFFISIPVSAILVRRVTRPIRRIACAAEEFSIATNVRNIKVNRNDEIGQLAGSFNRMAGRLSDAHAALLQINEGLEVTVAERTAEIRLMNDLLQQEVHSKNEFIRTITHDLNAPLRNIAGMAQMIRKHHGEKLPPEVLQRIERIEANVAIESSMLDDLLELSRLRTRPYRREDLDVAAMLEEIRQTLGSELLERNIDWVVPDDLPVIHLEARLFRQVFLNLIDNAIKYMGERPVRRISIEVIREDRWLLFSVADTGPGITPEAQKRVFELFSRGSTAQIDEHMAEPGRGVGLANVKTVVERWEGTIELESDVGAGCVFRVRIPIEHIVGDWPEAQADEIPQSVEENRPPLRRTA